MYYCISAIMLREKDVRAVKFNVYSRIFYKKIDISYKYTFLKLNENKLKLTFLNFSLSTSFVSRNNRIASRQCTKLPTFCTTVTCSQGLGLYCEGVLSF